MCVMTNGLWHPRRMRSLPRIHLYNLGIIDNYFLILLFPEGSAAPQSACGVAANSVLLNLLTLVGL